MDTNYFGSRIIENGDLFFICIKKDEKIQVSEPSVSGDILYITDNEFMYEKELSDYMHIEVKYLNERIDLLRLFKAGNIGFYDVFFHYVFNVWDFFNNVLDKSTHNQTRNTIENKRFSLEQSEISLCNQWLIDYCGAPYMLLKDSIDEFSWGMEQVDVPTGFEQYTTALEMTLLPQNQPGKKQMLANRISTLLGTTDVEIQQIHKKILDFYRFRSESLHEGNGSNITKSELQELENITREVLKKCLKRCKSEYCINKQVTWGEIKDMIIKDLIASINVLKNSGIL